MGLFLGVAGVILLAGCLLVSSVTQPGVRPRSVELPARASASELEAHVRRICGEYRPRDHEHPEVLDALASYLGDALRAQGAVVREQAFLDGRYRNVVARFGPSASDEPLIVVGAHYDTCGPLPGADDNASGVAGLLELGRLLGAAGLTRPIELVAYTLEEPPYFRTENMGSAIHARDLKRRQAKVEFMLSLEMIGCFSDEPGSQSYPAPGMSALFPSVGNFIALIGRPKERALVRRLKGAMLGANDLPVVSANLPASLPGVDFSDHLNYWEQGFPALMVTDTAFARNQRYHTAEDTPDTLDYVRMAKVVDQVFAALR